jgi:hypothetical protein
MLYQIVILPVWYVIMFPLLNLKLFYCFIISLLHFLLTCCSNCGKHDIKFYPNNFLFQLFYLVTELYKEGNAKEMKKWAYEIHSSFLVPGAVSFCLKVCM